MPAISDPVSGLLFYELSHEWGHGAPTLPGYEDVKIFRPTTHAKNGVMAQRIRTVMHTGTHLNAPIHLVQKGEGAGQIAMEKCFGPGVVLSIPKGEWELVTPTDLEEAKPAVEAGQIVVIVTGWHEKYSDSIEYFGHSPGLSAKAASWLAEKRAKLVAVDTPQVDHPLATSLGLHRNGPQMKRIPAAYEAATGRKAAEDFPDWNPAHRILLEAGIPTIENVGGDVAELAGGRAVFHAMPWNWHEGDACPIRFVGMVDPTGNYRVESGDAA
jgi:kynurenine formamidase